MEVMKKKLKLWILILDVPQNSLHSINIGTAWFCCAMKKGKI